MRIGKVYLGASLVLLLTALYLFGDVDLCLATVLAAFVHELGHLIAIWAAGGHIRALQLQATGGVIVKSGLRSYGREAVAALAGPLASLLWALLAALGGRWLDSSFLYLTAGISLVFAIFNLLPIQGLDGGRALYMALAARLELGIAEKICCFLSVLCLLALIGLGAWALLGEGHSPSILIGAAWVLAMFLKQGRWPGN